MFEIPTKERLEKFQAKALSKVDRRKPKGTVADNPKDLIAAMNVEKKLLENLRREKEAAVTAQSEKHPEIRDGEKVNEIVYHTLLCQSFVEMFKKLIVEIRATQIYVDLDGIVSKRTTAKKALRKVDKIT